MKEELLREDEREAYENRGCYECDQDEQIELLCQRLIEERERNAKLKLDFVEAFEGKFAELRERAEKAEAAIKEG